MYYGFCILGNDSIESENNEIGFNET